MYEAIHIHGTSPFDLSVIEMLHNIAEYTGKYLHNMLTKGRPQLNKPTLIMSKPSVYLEISDKIKTSAQVQGTSSTGYIISINVSEVSEGDVDDVLFINILHELAHVLQRENGVYASQSSIDSNGNPINDIHFNDPTEVNAYLLSIVGIITYSKQKLEMYAAMPFDRFYVAALHELNPRAERLFDTHMSKGDPHNSTKDQLIVTLKLIHKRLQSGYFSHLPKK